MLKGFILLFILICIYLQYKENSIPNPCHQTLTDDAYIHHMIQHHEVAVYMSEIQLHNTKNPVIMDIVRNIIRLQKYEIAIMKDSTIVDTSNSSLNDEMSDTNIKMDTLYRGRFYKTKYTSFK